MRKPSIGWPDAANAGIVLVLGSLSFATAPEWCKALDACLPTSAAVYHTGLLVTACTAAVPITLRALWYSAWWTWSRFASTVTVQIWNPSPKDGEEKTRLVLFPGDTRAVVIEARWTSPPHPWLLKRLMRNTLLYLKVGSWNSLHLASARGPRRITADRRTIVSGEIATLPHVVRLPGVMRLGWEMGHSAFSGIFRIMQGGSPIPGNPKQLEAKARFCLKHIYRLSRQDDRVFHRIPTPKHLILRFLTDVEMVDIDGNGDKLTVITQIQSRSDDAPSRPAEVGAEQATGTPQDMPEAPH